MDHDSIKIRWSWKYDECQKCGTSERKHRALGLCSRCFEQHRAPARKLSKIQKAVYGSRA